MEKRGSSEDEEETMVIMTGGEDGESWTKETWETEKRRNK